MFNFMKKRVSMGRRSRGTNLRTLNLPKKSSVDVVVPIWDMEKVSQHPSYHGSMTGTEAESLLEQHGRNGYLTRYSKYKKLFKLSVLRRVQGDELLIAHFTLAVIKKDASLVCTYKLEGSKRTFTDVSELLEFYKTAPLTCEIDGIGDWIEPRVRLPVKYPCDVILVNNSALEQDTYFKL